MLFDARMLPRLAIVTLFASAACAHPVPLPHLRAPNPNGCYAVVYEKPSFEGAADVLNGPVRLSMLERVPETNVGNWHQRIRSLRLGPTAIVTAHVDTAFKGYGRRFEPATEHPQLERALSARIQSLEVACVERVGLRQ
jgi:hypothetical protein